jgi:hypothetical protein
VRVYPSIRISLLLFVLILTLLFMTFCADSIGEYLSDALRQVLAEQSILAQFSYPAAHAQNGVAERKHRHLLETARTLMIAFFVPPHF